MHSTQHTALVVLEELEAAAAGVAPVTKDAACPFSRAENLRLACAVLPLLTGTRLKLLAAAGIASPRNGIEDVRAFLAAARGLLTRTDPVATPRPAPREETVARLLGRAPALRSTRIMVTLGGDDAGERARLAALLAGGMEVVRINTAREGVDEWRALAAAVRHEASSAGRTCRILADLPGPKLRTADAVGDAKGPAVRAGDCVVLLRSQGGDKMSEDRTRDGLPVVAVTHPGALDGVRVGDRVMVDDGKIDGVVEELRGGRIVVRMVAPPHGRKRIKAQRSVNLPDSGLSLPPIAEGDRAGLRFAAEAADMVALSYLRTAAEVRQVSDALPPEARERVGIIVKIERQEAVANIEEILLAAIDFPNAGILLARGDLAVECGFEALPELQERILLLARAAHLPLFWCTEVLATMSRKGVPSRAGMTDAYAARRADCVMLNRGRHTLDALAMLDRLLATWESEVDQVHDTRSDA